MRSEYVQLQEKGFLDIQVDQDFKFSEAIINLKKQKNAIILGHYYQIGDIQDISDYIGDSLGLAQQAAKSNADIIVMAGVHFMAETVKILCPSKKILIPDLKAGCSLSDSCPTPDFEAFVKAHPGYTVISYINTTAEIKALSDIICTSSNAKQVVESLPKDEKIIFAPDKNLGNYINSLTGRNMLLWNGACHVHQQFNVEKIARLKKENTDAKLVAHPECNRPVLIMADYIASTTGLLKFTINDTANKYIVATEAGILHQMRKASPQKTFIPAPPDDASCACNDCNFMKLNTLKKVYICLKYEQPEIVLDLELMNKAYKSIKRMMEISEKA